MTRVIEFLISLVIVAALFVVIALFLPAQRSFEYSVETNRPMSTVFDLLNGFTRFKDWNPLLRYDPRMQTSIDGAPSGVGARFNYESRDRVIGKGNWEIIESVPGEMIKYRLTNSGRGGDKTMTLRFERTGQRNQNIKITQSYEVKYGWDLIGRYAGLYVTRNVGDDVRRGLDKFTNLLAQIPKYDYSQHTEGFAYEEEPARDVLLVTTASRRDSEEIATAMNNQLSWIRKVMESNGLVADGPVRIVTNEFTGDSYGFDVVQPVRKADAPPNAVAGEPLNVTLESTVQYAQIPARRVATTTYIGPAPGLARMRDVLRAWTLVHGGETTGQPFEDYLGGVDTMLDEDARFKVYWPVKN